MLDTTTFRFTREGKVAFYNQVLNRYNDFADKRRQEPQLVVVNKAYNNEENKVEQENKIETSIENEMIVSVPKAMKQKAWRLLDKIKCVAVWNDRVELVYRNNAVYMSNIVDLVNDVLRKRKLVEPVGWKMFVLGFKDVNTPIDLVGNPGRWIHMQTASVDEDDTPKESDSPFGRYRQQLPLWRRSCNACVGNLTK